MPRHPRCDVDRPHRFHVIVVTIGTDDEPLFTQYACPGEPEPLHGHGDGPHPDACFECWNDQRMGLA